MATALELPWAVPTMPRPLGARPPCWRARVPQPGRQERLHRRSAVGSEFGAACRRRRRRGGDRNARRRARSSPRLLVTELLTSGAVLKASSRDAPHAALCHRRNATGISSSIAAEGTISISTSALALGAMEVPAGHRPAAIRPRRQGPPVAITPCTQLTDPHVRSERLPRQGVNHTKTTGSALKLLTVATPKRIVCCGLLF